MMQLENLSIHQGEFALTDLNMKLPAGGYGVLMGPTGCGKTTIVEAVCGLRRITSGAILIGQKNVTHMAASQRQIGYVPQDAVLFPTMQIAKQIEFGLAVRKISREIRLRRVDELAEMLEIQALLNRTPEGLSGGERQRVALARALAISPMLLCLDEPLSALDESARERMIGFLQIVHRREQTTILHITHNSVEAQELATVQFAMTKADGIQRVSS